MKLKLDENLGQQTAQIFREAGHDVATVPGEGLLGVYDNALYQRCMQEERCLVTLDLDFSNVIRFPPEPTAGLAVLRPPGRPTIASLSSLAKQMVDALSREFINGHLWIVEPGRIRIHEPPEGTE